MRPKRILLLLAGEPDAALTRAAGDYAAWFGEAFGPGALLEPVAAYAGSALPDPGGFDGLAMTGSPLSVTDYEREPWMQRAGEYLLAAAESGTPVLGVCFGHQLLARAAGGSVQVNPRGREVGTIEVALTGKGRAHPVLGALPDLRFQATHRDVVTALPDRATLLAENDIGVQAFALGSALCVQFHPELDARRMALLIDGREAILRADGTFERAKKSVRQSPAGPALLRTWLQSLRG